LFMFPTFPLMRSRLQSEKNYPRMMKSLFICCFVFIVIITSSKNVTLVTEDDDIVNLFGIVQSLIEFQAESHRFFVRTENCF
jgi:hypothetical protein